LFGFLIEFALASEACQELIGSGANMSSNDRWMTSNREKAFCL
jgi:hypothetical protein